jgi:hypothetical protein
MEWPWCVREGLLDIVVSEVGCTAALKVLARQTKKAGRTGFF